MILLFAKEFRIQASIVEQLALNGNADYIDLYEKMILGIKLISDAKSDIDLAKILRWHEGADKKGYLRKPNDNCLSIDLDAEHRLDVYRINDKAIVISSIGHYELLKQLKLFKDLDFVVKEIFKPLLHNTSTVTTLDKHNKHTRRTQNKHITCTDSISYFDFMINKS